MHLSSRALLSALVVVASPLASSLAFGAGAQGNIGATSINYRALQVQATREAAAGKGSEYFVNPYRAYPPSCLNAPLPFGLDQNDPSAVVKTVTLTGDPLSGDANEQNYTENDTISIFRVPCGANASALLLEIDRPANATASPYPVFPGISINGTTISNTSVTGFVPRVANDPNTYYSTVYAFDPLTESNLVVFENYTSNAFPLINYDQALTVTVNNLSSSNAVTTTFNIPAYNPSAYAANLLPLPISGYQSGNFFDPNHSGEGIQVEVGDVDTTHHFISIAWYTYDDSGTPYWLIGSSTFTIGATQVGPIQMYYGANGGFAGNFGAAATFAPWGTVTVNFPNCNTMQFSYTSNNGLPAPVPLGNGSKTWTRASQLNGLTCQ